MQVVYTDDDPLKRDMGGRPRKLLPDEQTLNRVRGLASIFCTLAEAAKVLGVTEKTFIEFLNMFTAAREAWDEGQAGGKVSLRRQQVAMAQDNVAMAIFLGKNYLGQSDKRTLEHQHGIKPLDPNADQTAAAEAYAEIINLPPSLRLIAPTKEIDLEATEISEADAEIPPDEADAD